MSVTNETQRQPTSRDLIELYRQMQLIRRIETRLGEVMKTGNIPGPAHLYLGQEAVAAGVCAHLSSTDWVASTHRGHGHFIAKGGDPSSMVAEIYGRRTGVCGGKGGSMHVADFSKGILGANGIVGGGIGLATGAALAAQLAGRQQVSVAFFGDGAANQGVLGEALNIATLWSLPLILVCESNGFSEFSPTASVTSGAISDRAIPFGAASQVCNGNDVIDVWTTMYDAMVRARQGGGPSLIEARTYRTAGHVESEASFLSKAYRSEEEIEFWRGRDPIDELLGHISRASPGIPASELSAIDAGLETLVTEIFADAESADWPEPEEALRGVYA